MSTVLKHVTTLKVHRQYHIKNTGLVVVAPVVFDETIEGAHVGEHRLGVVDAVVLGEGEEVVGEITAVLHDWIAEASR